MQNAIIVQNLNKEFRRYHTHKPQTFQEAIVQGLRRLKPAEQFIALQDVSFSIPQGRMVGVIGRNGAGKSTLLRLVGGVGRPDRGGIKVNGRIGALLDLGAGFHPDLTGRENVFISGVIAGLTRRQVAQHFDDIVAFAELEEFIDNPLRTYSTGMKMRLAFAVAVHIDPDILLIDEVLAVGDMAFQRKCLARIEQFKQRGCTILLVSHDVGQVQQLCDEVIWLRKGQVAAHGPADVVVGQYKAEMSKETEQRTPTEIPVMITPAGTELRINENRFGSMEIKIESVKLLDSVGMPVAQMSSGEPLSIEIEYQAPQPIATPIFGVTISRDDGFIFYDTYVKASDIAMPVAHGRGKVALSLDRLDLVSSHYYVDVGIYEQDWAYAYDYHWHVYPLIIDAADNGKGVLYPPHSWRVISQQSEILIKNGNTINLSRS